MPSISKILKAAEKAGKTAKSPLSGNLISAARHHEMVLVLRHDMGLIGSQPFSAYDIYMNVYRELLAVGDFTFMDLYSRRWYEWALAEAIYSRFKINLAVKLMAKLNLYFLTKCVLGYKDLEPYPHGAFTEHLQQNISQNTNVLPRGYFKTTTSTKSGSIFLIINNPNIRILICNATATNAELFLKEIKAHFESNDLFRGLFSELIPSNWKEIPWSNNKMQVVRSETWSEPTIYAVGTETNVTSGHFNVIIKDDLVNEDHLTSPEMMSKPIEWEKMSHSLYVPETDPGKKLDWSTGTRWSYFDYMADRLENTPKEQQFVLSCYDEEGKSTFPEKFPEKELDRIKIAQGPKVFGAQYLNNPLPGELAVFKEEWLKYYDNVPEGEPMRKYMMVDPAISEAKTADNRAIIVVGVMENMDWYILDYVRGIFPMVDDDLSGKRNLTQEIFRLYAVWKPEFVGIEESGFQKALTYHIEGEKRRRNVFFGITRLIPRNRQTKIMRIETLAAPFAAGRVYLKENMKELKSELLGFPAGRYRDLIDALSYLMQYEVPPSEPLTSEYNPLSMRCILEEMRNRKNKKYPFEFQLAGR